MLGFFNPITLLVFQTSLTFIVVVPVTLLIWFAARWEEITKIKETSTLIEILLGIGLYAVNIGRNASQFATRPFFGLIDMFVAFVSVCIIFYGLRGLRNFILPTAYLAVLIVGYQLEFAITEVGFLQTFLANLIGFLLNILGISATVNGINITIHAPEGPISLGISADCTGLKSMLAYGSLAILMILDVKAPIRKKILWATVGLIGTFFVNILRLLSIFLAVHFLGFEAGYSIHTYLGYTLFIAWVFVFWTIAFKYLNP